MEGSQHLHTRGGSEEGNDVSSSACLSRWLAVVTLIFCAAGCATKPAFPANGAADNETAASGTQTADRYFFDVIGEWVTPYAISNSGQVVGSIGDAGGHQNESAFLWSKKEGFRELGPLPEPDCDYSCATCVSDGGVVIIAGTLWSGSAKDNEGEKNFRWSESQQMRPIATRPLVTRFEPILIDERGRVLGLGRNSDGTSSVLEYDPATGTKTIWDMGKRQCGIIAVNRNYWVVGAGFSDGKTPAYVWAPGRGVKELGVLPGGACLWPVAINDSATVVGSAMIPLKGEDRNRMRFEIPFIWSPDAGVKAIPLPSTLSRFGCIRAARINNRGQILLRADRYEFKEPASAPLSYSPLKETRSFLLDKGVLKGLPEFPTSAYTDYCALNDQGQLIGVACIKRPDGGADVSVGFLATPVPKEQPRCPPSLESKRTPDNCGVTAKPERR